MSETSPPKRIPCGFTCIVDTREQRKYTFESLWDGPAGKSNLIDVPVIHECLPVGDYAICGHPGLIVERKSKADLYGSISQARENFEDRLRRMHEGYDCPWVLVEAEWQELLTDPPKHSKFNPKSLSRTILAWMIRYDRVHWLMAPSRAHAEAFCFRLMDRYVKENQSIDRACLRRPLKAEDLEGIANINDAVYAKANAEAETSEAPAKPTKAKTSKATNKTIAAQETDSLFATPTTPTEAQ